jgi:hypothetical protein
MECTLPKPPRPITAILLYFLILRAYGKADASFCLFFPESPTILA